MFKSTLFFKTITISLLTLGTQLTSFAQVEEGLLKAKKNSIKISPTAFAVSTFALSYERYISTSVSFQFSGGLMAASKSTDKSNNNNNNNVNLTGNTNNYNTNTSTPTAKKDKASGGFAELMVKFYFLKGKSVMSGLYFAPYGRYGKNSFEINREITTNSNIYNYNSNTYSIGYTYPAFKYSIESYEGGAVFGFNWVIGNAFVMDMYLGGGLKVSNNTSRSTYQKSDRSFSILESQDYTGITPKGGLRIGFVF
jgi:hypothetical protein